MIIFEAEVTVSGTVTFLGNAVNKGVINGNAVFKGSSQNGTGDDVPADEEDAPPPDGIVNGNATFEDSSANMVGGDVGGTGTFNDCADNGGTVDNEINNRKAGCPPNRFQGPYLDFNPPLVAGWVFRSGGGGGGFRRISAIGSQNNTGLDDGSGQSRQGPWQKCPDNGSCRESPETYRAAAPFHYVLDARVVQDVNGTVLYANNVPDYYCLPENYTRPLNRGYWFDCEGCVVGPDGRIVNGLSENCASEPPAQIQNLVAYWEPEFRLVTGETVGTIVLSWTPLADLNSVDEYVVERRKNDEDWTTIDTWTADQVHNSAMYSNGVPAADDGVGVYEFRVTAVSQGVSGEPSAPAEFVVGISTVSNVSGAVSQTDPTAVDLSWSTPEDIFSSVTGYRIDRSKDGSFPAFFVEISAAEAHATSPPSVTIPNANNLGPGAYKFRVTWVANNNTGIPSSSSNEIIFS